MSSLFNRLKTFVVNFNLIDDESNDEKIKFYQRLSTRIFLITFLILSISYLIYISLSKQTTTIEISNPSFTKIEHLYQNYADTLNCPCSQIAIPYSYLVDEEINHYQICTSEFINEEWIEKSYQANSTYIWPLDIRTIASAFLRNLRSLCFLSNMTITNALSSFASQTMITNKALSSKQFDDQVQSSTLFVEDTTYRNIYISHSITQEIISCNQLVSGLGTNVLWKLHLSPERNEMLTNPIVYIDKDNNRCNCELSQYCVTPAGLFPDVMYTKSNQFSAQLYNGLIKKTMIPEWLGGCFPLISLYRSKLWCFYDLNCLHILIGRNDTKIQPLDPHIDEYIPIRNVMGFFQHLFVKNWTWTKFYKNYFMKCAPVFCTYSYTHRNGFIYIVTTCFGFIGGLSNGLHIFVKYIILRLFIWNMKRKMKRQRTLCITDHCDVSQARPSVKQYLSKIVRQIQNKIVELNLFAETIWIKRTNLTRQRWATRLFFISLITAFLIRTIYIIIEKKTAVHSLSVPTQNQYENLLKTYPNTLECPCTNISINYQKMFSINPRYHQICSSMFVEPKWYERLRKTDDMIAFDFRVSANALFRLVNSLCGMTKYTIDSSILRFNATPFITYHITDEKVFDEQANAIFANFIKMTQRKLLDILNLVSSLTSASQFISSVNVNSFGYVNGNFTIFYKQKPFGHDFLSLNSCYCARDLHCEADAQIYYYNSSAQLILPLVKLKGFIVSCYLLDSLLKSSPECLYNKACVSTLLSFFRDQYIPVITLNSTTITRFPLNTTFENIINELFVEDWGINHSYASFFKQCMPSHCSYSISARHNVLFIITTLIALYGGLSTVLEMILPHLVNLITAFINKLRRRSTENRSQKTIIQPLLVRLRTKLIQFNIFTSKPKERNIVQEERISTRIYILMTIIILSGFILYTTLSKSTHVGTINEPMEKDFHHLYESYSDTIICSVSNISIKYDKFVKINYSIHEICPSNFVRKEIIRYFFFEFISPLPSDDFRGQAINYFHLISSFCSLTTTLLTDTLDDFKGTSLINGQMISQQDFSSQMESILVVLNETLSSKLTKLLKLFEDNIQGNQFITLSASNWKFLVRYTGMQDLVRSIPVIRTNCSCATSNKCFEKAKVYLNENETYFLTGIQLGCTPLNSLLASTLECFYNRQCLEYLMEVFQIPPTLSKLDLNKTHFHPNTTIRKIVENFFIEEWNISVNYSSFYIHSHPKQCSYSYAKRNDLVNIFLETLSFYGGLAGACRFIVPLIVNLFFKIKQRLQR